MLLDIRCKTGKLQLEEGILRSVNILNKIIWQIPTGEVTRIVIQPSGIAYTIFIYTEKSTYTIETVTKANAEKLQSLFPHLETENAERATHWYQNITKKAHVETYTNRKHMQKDIEQAAQYGWVPQTSAGIGSHINVGRTVTGMVLTGGLNLLFGGSRSKEKITITFIRNS
jgi:hypothetical protein